MMRSALLCAALLAAVVSSALAAVPVYESRDGGLFVDGQRFHIRGINWFGMETKDYVVHGLWSVSMNSILDKLQALKFNALRLPVSCEMVLKNEILSTSIDFDKNPNLKNKRALEGLDILVAAAAQRGMLVMLDMHALSHDGLSQEGLWYSSAYPESSVLRMWDTLIARYRSAWNVFAADLKNEPWGATWGSGDSSTDFRLAAQRIGSYVAERAPWLVFVEGIGSHCGGKNYPWCYWGEGLNNASFAPVVLSVANRLVYSPHAYTKSIGDMSYYHEPSYPAMMPAVWGEHFGYLRAQGAAAVVPGEWGGDPNANADTKVWMTAWVDYLNKADITDNFFWCVNPNSGDTGGLLANDWSTVDTTGRFFFISAAQKNPFSFAAYAAAGGTPGKQTTTVPVPEPASTGAPGPAPEPASTQPAPVDPCAVQNGGCGPADSTACLSLVGLVQCSCRTGFFGKPPATPCAPVSPSCPFVATDAGSNAYWLAYSIATQAGTAPKSVVAVQGGQSIPMSGPFNWGNDKPAVFTANPSGFSLPFVLRATDSAGATSSITVTEFAGGQQFRC